MPRPDAHHRIDYLEFAVASIAASRSFFGQAFDWTFQDYGPDYCEFRDGRLTGGFFHGPVQPGGPLVVLYSNDLAATQARIETAGGRITQPVYDFPGGRRFHFADPDGYAWAVWSET
ncbi:VOC family protein [Stenotrophomonas sp. MMGLT7]|uniref:VOC family protein n=1 Tax=Stenotrophomonas sp. MMGLT7 TaxID=2901227 RepID=UPI001E5688E0|nr:VOC family protein [Stenotrophomonas sp. MMGLT7]MCD7099615.1 VOC family protein [Stenotrophomonas sp. MMGLT7]